jgi:hypothetical protein
MKTLKQTEEKKPKLGAPFKGDKPRVRYNVTLNPDLVAQGKKLALSTDISFSELLENGLKKQLGVK